jgi:hypothetical protein
MKNIRGSKFGALRRNLETKHAFRDRTIGIEHRGAIALRLSKFGHLGFRSMLLPSQTLDLAITLITNTKDIGQQEF